MSNTVLVVDDHPLVREVVKSMLEARGINVVLAKEGSEALERFVEENVRAALVDVDMPGPNGVEVCRSLRDCARHHERNLAVWLMTGVERPGLVERAKAAGALGVIAKPFTTEELLARVENMLAESSAAA